MTEMNPLVFPDVDALATAAAERWCALAADAVAQRGRFDIALAGGSTPRSLHQLLASPPWRDRCEHAHSRFWFGDERCVAPDHPDSNYRMARETLLEPLGIAPAQVFRIAGEREPRAAAADYAATLRTAFTAPADRPPRLDLLLLGLGPDGHIASLFPDTPLLDETRAWVGACHVDRLDAWRISLTYPLLNAARHTLILVAGDSKAAIIRALHEGNAARPAYPVERLRPSGPVEWLLDADAAAGLPAAAPDPDRERQRQPRQ